MKQEMGCLSGCGYVCARVLQRAQRIITDASHGSVWLFAPARLCRRTLLAGFPTFESARLSFSIQTFLASTDRELKRDSVIWNAV